MLRVGELREAVAERIRPERLPRYKAALEHWMVVDDYIEWEFLNDPSHDRPENEKRARLLKTADLAAYHQIYCRLRISQLESQDKSTQERQAISSQMELKALEDYANLGPARTGRKVLGQWRKLIIEVHGNALKARRAGTGSVQMKAWKGLIEATKAYDALEANYGFLSKRNSMTREDPNPIFEGATQGECEHLSPIE